MHHAPSRCAMQRAAHDDSKSLVFESTEQDRPARTLAPSHSLRSDIARRAR
jgi:hypothetical protein